MALSGLAHAADRGRSEAAEKLECDVQFEVQNFYRDSYLLQPSTDYPASVPNFDAGQPSFVSYMVDLDWRAHTAELHATSSPTTPSPVSFAITSEPSDDFIELEVKPAAGAAKGFPSRVYIRRTSGWFMRLAPSATRPTTGVTEIGVCGRDRQF